MGKSLLVFGLAAVAVLSAGAASAQTRTEQYRAPQNAAPRKAPASSNASSQCFRASDWRGWKATPDGRAMYIEAGFNRIYRFDLAQSCRELNSIGARLITRTDKPLICRPIDVNMRVQIPGAGISYCQVSRITRLSPAEAKALPRSLRP